MIILLHSPKGGVGTSAVAANLALALAQRGQYVTAIDLTGQGGLALQLGGNPGSGDPLDTVADTLTVIEGVRVIAAAGRRPGADVIELIASHDGGNQVVIVDVAAGDRQTLDLLLPRVGLRLCVMATEPGALATMPQVLSDLQRGSVDITYFILNKVDERLRLARDITGLFRSLFGDRLIGTIRRDEAVNEAVAMMESLPSFAPASAALADYADLAGRVGQYLSDHAVPYAGRGASGDAA